MAITPVGGQVLRRMIDDCPAPPLWITPVGHVRQPNG